MPTVPGPLLQHLPAIYHAGASEELCQLLSLLEGVLFGPSDGDGAEGLEQKIARLPGLFSPDPPPTAADPEPLRTPREFLPWLAGWVALGQYQGLPEAQLRRIIARIVPLYGRRGTKGYLEKILEFFLPPGAAIRVDDQVSGLTVGRSRVGLDAWLGAERPFWFRVTIRTRAAAGDPLERARLGRALEDSLRPVIDLAKPAHTDYQLDWEFGD